MVNNSTYGIVLCGGGAYGISYAKRKSAKKLTVGGGMKGVGYYLEYAANIAAIVTGLAIWFLI